MKVLMCPPKYFSIEYEINPWMDKNNNVDNKLAQSQWDTLVSKYSELGVEVETIEPIEGLPDMVFTANAGLVTDHTAIVSNFKYPQRKPETAYFRDWFVVNGFKVVQLDQNEYFEGQGEALAIGDSLIVGHGFRANLAGHQKIKENFKGNVISVRLIDPRFYHLDTCFLPLNSETAVYYPAAFDDSSKMQLKSSIPNLIEVSEEEAKSFGCNSVIIGKKVLIPQGSPYLLENIRKLGLEPIELDISEFKKSGGAIRCLTLTLEN